MLSIFIIIFFYSLKFNEDKYRSGSARCKENPSKNSSVVVVVSIAQRNREHVKCAAVPLYLFIKSTGIHQNQCLKKKKNLSFEKCNTKIQLSLPTVDKACLANISALLDRAEVSFCHCAKLSVQINSSKPSMDYNFMLSIREAY